MSSHLAETYKRSRMPLYLQVAAVLRRRIEDGHWTAGAKISTLEELEEEFQVARVTVRQAVDVLQKEGLVVRQQGRGTFVTEQGGDRRWLRLATSWPSLIATIRTNVPQFLETENPPPFPRIDTEAALLADEYVFLRSLQGQDGRPYAVANVHVAMKLYDMAPERFGKETALGVVSSLKKARIERAHQTLVIGSADTESANLLKVPLNAPTAEAHCVVVDEDGIAIYVGDIIYRGDCVKLDIDLL